MVTQTKPLFDETWPYVSFILITQAESLNSVHTLQEVLCPEHLVKGDNRTGLAVS